METFAHADCNKPHATMRAAAYITATGDRSSMPESEVGNVLRQLELELAACASNVDQLHDALRQVMGPQEPSGVSSDEGMLAGMSPLACRVNDSVEAVRRLNAHVLYIKDLLRV